MRKIHNKLIFSYLLAVFLLVSTQILAQKNLRQSAFFTEKEGINEHNHLASLYQSKKEWKKRAKLIKEGILEGAELTKFKSGQTINATIHSKKIMDGYTVENVFFESVPGIFVTGNLYKPIQINGKVPGILRPHGHGEHLRFGEDVQKFGGSLARMGAIVFAYDMIGHGDMLQCQHEISKALKLQLVNSIRCLDFLSQLPEVDTKRLAISGESGGGTQTFMLCAVDDRPLVSIPVVMASSYFFGGCVCESAMPIHIRPTHETTNVEIAACHAPKPLALISVGTDWTKLTPEVELPHIQRIYEFFGKQNLVENSHFESEEHNYGPSKREAAIGFLCKHLGLNIKLYDENKVKMLSKKQLSVFDDTHQLPSHAAKGDEAVMKIIDGI